MRTQDLAQRAQQLSQDGVAVETAVRELVRLSDGRQFELSAAYATAVRHGGGEITPAAELLDLARYEREGAWNRAIHDPDRLAGRAVTAYMRAMGWGVHWLAIAIAVVVVVVGERDGGVTWWIIVGLAGWIVARVAVTWFVSSRRVWWEHADQRDVSGAVPPLARMVARECVFRAQDTGADDPVDRLRQVALGGSRTSLAHRRAGIVIREAAWLVASIPLTPTTSRRARRLLRAVRARHAQTPS